MSTAQQQHQHHPRTVIYLEYKLQCPQQSDKRTSGDRMGAQTRRQLKKSRRNAGEESKPVSQTDLLVFCWEEDERQCGRGREMLQRHVNDGNDRRHHHRDLHQQPESTSYDEVDDAAADEVGEGEQ